MHIYTNANNPEYKTLDHWLQLDTSVAPNNTFNLTLFSGKENETTRDGELIENTLNHNYGRFTVYNIESYSEFVAEWTRFKSVHLHEFERMYTALYTDYNPIENYDKHSEIVDDGETGAPSNSPITANMYQVSDDTVNAQSPFIPQGKTETSGKTEIDNTRTEHTHGNIGITKSTDMVMDEINARIQYDFVNIVCRMFADEELI